MKLVWMPPRCRFLMFACLKFLSFISVCNGRAGAAAGAAASTEMRGQARAGAAAGARGTRSAPAAAQRLGSRVEELVPAFPAILTRLCRQG